jgi:hypothetical protein
MNNRIQLLNSLLEFDKPPTEIVPALNSFSWDSKQPLITLQRQHIVNILQGYLNGKFSASDVENWANAIEGREDIAQEDDFKDILNEVIFALANPLLSRPLSPNSAQKYLAQLETTVVHR